MEINGVLDQGTVTGSRKPTTKRGETRPKMWAYLNTFYIGLEPQIFQQTLTSPHNDLNQEKQTKRNNCGSRSKF